MHLEMMIHSDWLIALKPQFSNNIPTHTHIKFSFSLSMISLTLIAHVSLNSATLSYFTYSRFNIIETLITLNYKFQLPPHLHTITPPTFPTFCIHAQVEILFQYSPLCEQLRILPH